MNDPALMLQPETEAALRAEIVRLKKMVQALMNRAERSTSAQGSDFGLFQTAVTLEDRVRRRTEDLEAALHENEKINRALHQAKQQMECEIAERRRAQEALHQSEERYRTATEAALDAFITLNEENVIVFVNAAAERIFGYAPGEMIGRDLNMLLPPRLHVHRKGGLQDCFPGARKGSAWQGIEIPCLHKDGHEIAMEISFGEFDYYGKRFHTGIARDITERKRAESLREGQQRVLEMIALDRPLEESIASLLVCIEDQCKGMRGCVLLVEAERIVKGIAPSFDQTCLDAMASLDIGPCTGPSAALYRREPVIAADVLADPLWEECREQVARMGVRACWSMPIFAGGGKLLGAFSMYCVEARGPSAGELKLIELAVRIAGLAIERKQYEAYIRHIAHHDPLTGLPNRLLLEDRMRQAIAQANRRHGRVALLFIDLDHFKHINDTLGHHIGDGLLQAVARRMECCLREGDSLARLGGDEFVICISDVNQSRDAAAVAHKIQDELARPFVVEGNSLQVGSSIGIALYPLDGGDVEEMMKAADTAMYEAKSKGRGNYQFFTPELNIASQQRMIVSNQLRQAFARGELAVHYQPQVSISSGAIIGAEALLRWEHPEMGMVSPKHVISLLEEIGMMGEIGKWVLSTACAQNRAWQQAGLPPIRMAVNLSARQFYGGDIVATVAEVLQETGLAPNWLDLEITESLILDNSEPVMEAMRQLKELGVGLALDDFGTGYSSLSYLRRFPVNRLKIDNSFITDIIGDNGAADIVRSILALAQKFGLAVVAEGVETETQFGYLQKQGCPEMQGFLFSPALPAEQMSELLRSDRRLHIWTRISNAARTILVVDDVEDVRTSLDLLLQEHGYQVLTASCSVEALAVLAKSEVGVVLADLRMPGGDGVGLLRQVRNLYPDITRMLLTGNADIGSLVDAINKGAIYKIVMKPWNIQTLVDDVRDAFAHYVAGRESAGMTD
ncbi:MAG TPA: EAL domain-containing protein [Paucimonas sp.]|nr:EAL domain-containing protein [Paucimonas sp.]